MKSKKLKPLLFVFLLSIIGLNGKNGSSCVINSNGGSIGTFIDSITPNLFAGLGYSDTKKIQLALDLARVTNQKLVIANNYERDSSIWMIDSAIKLNSNEYIIIQMPLSN